MDKYFKNQIIEKEIAVDVPYSSDVDYVIFSRVLKVDRVVASYKMYWLLAILEEVQLGYEKIDFRKLICRMISNAWYPIKICKLSFGAWDNLGKVVNYINTNLNIKDLNDKDKLIESLYYSNDKELNKMIKDLTYNVPYRFLSPFFEEELIGKRTGVEVLITELSLIDKRVVYSIHKDKVNGDYIVINEGWINYLKYNYNILKGWAFYHLVCFIQKRNPNVPGIAMKLEAPHSRKLVKQTKLWNEIITINGVKDIYTGLDFTKENKDEYGAISMDHFIPWSFVLHDQLWNLVPTFKNINSRKSDNLLPYDKYINEVCRLQYDALKYLVDKRKLDDVEDYRSILRLVDVKEFLKEGNFQEFINRYKEGTFPIYNIAKNQGFKVMDMTLEVYK